MTHPKLGALLVMTQTVNQATPHSVVGTSTRRQDAADKLTGRTRFAGDLPFPGLLHARLVMSPYAHARIVSIDTSTALKLPGVVAVLTSETLAMANANSPSRSQSPLAQKETFWCGHPVAVVLGETEAAAEDGVAAVDIVLFRCVVYGVCPCIRRKEFIPVGKTTLQGHVHAVVLRVSDRFRG